MPSPSCSFCGQSVSDSVQVVTGPSVHICSDCVATCGRVLEGTTASDWLTNAEGPCHFCKRGPDEASHMFSRKGADAAICSHCQKLCVEVLEEHATSTQ